MEPSESLASPPNAAYQSKPSPFFSTLATAQSGDLAILHLQRDSLLPVLLRNTANDGYAEGAVTNTRFGSYPHSTIIGVEWGSQVRASKVDTGSRGRRMKNGVKKDETPGDVASVSSSMELDDTKKRKASESASATPTTEQPTKRVKPTPETANVQSSPAVSTAIEAGSGFTHILPITPEAWTSSLDHRTQVVYTPDYSYILHRLNVRPGDTLIEAGAGSGSFTHAAARAVFNGYPTNNEKVQDYGRVCSFEYHEQRVHTLAKELAEQHLNSVVTLTHRDVCNEGFLLPTPSSTTQTDTPFTSPNANAIFLDLPAPWLALRHLTRKAPSPLNPNTAIHLCSFSPCIEQVTTTVAELRRLGWTEISMAEVAHRRIDVRREHVGLQHEGLRGVNSSPATVEEAISRARDVETKLVEFHSHRRNREDDENKIDDNKNDKKTDAEDPSDRKPLQSKQQRLETIRREARDRKSYREGNLVHRTEPEVRSHTSYLVFAVLPREWTAEQERACEEQWPVANTVVTKAGKKRKWEKNA